MANKIPQVTMILMSLIDRPAVPDRISIDPEEVKELAESIGSVGLKQPILLCPKGSRYEIVAGDRRYQACLSLGQTEINAFVEAMSDEDISILRATENLQRANLTVIEEARIYDRLHTKHGMSWERIAKQTGKSVGLVKRRWDLLRMPQILVDALHKKQINYSVAEELDRLKDVGRISYYLGFAVDHGATKEVVRAWVDEEQALTRQRLAAGGGGGGVFSPPEQKPVYITCDLCHGPVDVMQISTIRMCDICYKTIKQNM